MSNEQKNLMNEEEEFNKLIQERRQKVFDLQGEGRSVRSN